MLPKDACKYRPYPPVDLPDRIWPGRTIDKAPTWCSVDLRDGNQALVEPMGLERKLKFFDLLVRMGFKEIEVGFPAASQTELEFLRFIVDNDRIPDDVTIQVLTQAREELIRSTMRAIQGAKNVIVHVYNSTSTLQRRVVFGLERDGIVDIAVRGVSLVRQLAADMPDTRVTLEYSPESFTGTELDFALEISNAVIAAWQPTPENKLILNLPATVEMATPNVYADQIEWMGRHVHCRDSVILSVHPHNDRGTAVAAAELAMMAGADRVEGTLFGNGERTGNVDVLTLALNLYTQGVDPGLEIKDINEIADLVKECNRLPIHPRHPYVGDLVFTAFSGSHQDAIKKGLSALRAAQDHVWEVPYLPIDPADLGRSYEAIIRINSQSGKGGIAYVMEEEYGMRLPRKLQIEFSQIIQQKTDGTGQEITPSEIWEAFKDEYLTGEGRLTLVDHRLSSTADGRYQVTARLRDQGSDVAISGEGNGPIDAFVHAAGRLVDLPIRVSDYAQHALGTGSDARAVAFVEMAAPGHAAYGVATHDSTLTANLEAVVRGINRLLRSAGARVAAE